jgi:hypothetical protein
MPEEGLGGHETLAYGNDSYPNFWRGTGMPQAVVKLSLQ